MKARLDLETIARCLATVRKGGRRVSGEYFGAMLLLGDIEERFRVPSDGGRSHERPKE